MSLAFGRHYLAIPGPSVIPDRVLGAMHRASPNIYQGELVEMMPGLRRPAARGANREGKCRNLHCQWPWRLGGGQRQPVLARRQDPVGHHRALRQHLGAECQEDIALNVADKPKRAHSVTGARIGNGGAIRLREWLEKNAGVTLGIGLGMAAPTEPAYGDYLRVAHMGYVNAHMTLGVLSSVEAGMRSLGISHGTGALDAAAQAIADAV
jgi:aspartate aminotransferase-like enzyme